MMDSNGNVDGNLSVAEEELKHINAQVPPSMVHSGANHLGLNQLNADSADMTPTQLPHDDDRNSQFVSKIPRLNKHQRSNDQGYSPGGPPQPQNFNAIRGLADANRYQDQQSVGTTRIQEDLQNLYYQNIKLRDMVLVVVQKLENFIEKTMIVKERKKQANRGKPPENEVYVTKQQELDSYLKKIREDKRKIKKLREELEADPNFERMIESENIAKEQYRKLQQLLDDNMQLKRIHGGQEAILDTSAQQKEKREDIR